jgi:lysophospholipase L1-like esterase
MFSPLSFGPARARLRYDISKIFGHTRRLSGTFDLITKYRHPMEIAWDRIHPGTAGHMAIAQAWLKATGYL